MSSKTLTLSDSSVLAEFVRQEEFKGFFEKRIEVPPDYMGLLIRNGQFVEAYKGVHLSVNGMFDRLKGLIGGSQAISLLIADLKVFPGVIDLSGISKDNLEIKGTATIEIQVNPERPQGILGLMEGRKALTKSAMIARIAPHLPPRVFETAIARVKADEIRGNNGLQDLIQADIMKEIERIAGDLGVLIRACSVEFAVNDVEKKAMSRAAAERAAEQAEYDFTTLKRQLDREQESTIIHIAQKHEIDKINLANPAELERMVLQQEIDFSDARETGQRVQEMKILQHEIDMMKTERLAKFDEAIALAVHQGVDLNVVQEKRRVVERNTEVLDREHGITLRNLQRDADAEDRARARSEQRSNAAEDRTDHVKIREEDRDYDNDTRIRNAKANEEALRYARDGKVQDARTDLDAGRFRNDLQRDADKAALEKLQGLAGLEASQERERLERRIKEADSAHARAMEIEKQKTNAKLDEMSLSAKMTPEQLLAYNAGLSPAVAKILEEQVKAKAADMAGREALMREMVNMAKDQNVASAAQAKAMFETGIAGAVGTAAAAGGKQAPAAVAGMVPGAGEEKVDCPKCGRTNTAKARFCVGCGEQLRK
jgi:hypothetical protein